MAIYYNEWDPFMAQWLRNLIKAGHLPSGDVDERDIREITPDDLKGYTQHHFFAGGGGWAEALSLAGWPAGRPVWTGSCPCQPFSSAGKRRGEKDERHLWPTWFQLIRKCEPATVFGEQVASNLGREWFSGVCADLETVGYAVGAADLCAAGVGSPQIRQRLWWVADSASIRCEQRRSAKGTQIQGQCAKREREYEESKQTRELPQRPERRCGTIGLPDTRSGSNRSQVEREESIREDAAGSAGGIGGCGSAGRIPNAPIKPSRTRDRASEAGAQLQIAARGYDLPGGLCDSSSERFQEQNIRYANHKFEQSESTSGLHDTELGGRCKGSTFEAAPPSETQPDSGCFSSDRDTFWDDYDVIPFADGKARRIEPGTFPLAHGVPNRVGRLRGYGNAIVPQVAAVFIRACQEVIVDS